MSEQPIDLDELQAMIDGGHMGSIRIETRWLLSEARAAKDLRRELAEAQGRIAELEASRNSIDQVLTERFNRSVPIENKLYQIAAGKAPPPDEAACREMAVRLGVPEGSPSESHGRLAELESQLSAEREARERAEAERDNAIEALRDARIKVEGWLSPDAELSSIAHRRIRECFGHVFEAMPIVPAAPWRERALKAEKERDEARRRLEIAEKLRW